jgi:serine/threonine protein kinase
MIDFGVGSVGYQAPEQRFRRDEQIGVRTDLWGVGATVWSTYTGLRLDLHDEVFLVDDQDRPFGLPPVSQYRPCTLEFEQVVMSLLAVSPNLRPGGAAETLNRVRLLRQGGAGANMQSGSNPDADELQQLFASLVDPLWAAICATKNFPGRFIKFGDGELLCREGENSYHTYVLLQGSVAVEQSSNIIGEETREGTFLGEVATLTGDKRMASVRAIGNVYTCAFNAAQLERFVTDNPAVGIRLIRTLADRISQTHRLLRSRELSL